MVRFNIFILTILATFSGTLYADSAGDIITASGIKGGFVVHVGCGNGTTTAALRKNNAFIVHGLDTNPANVQKAREHIITGKYNGTVSAAEFDGKRLIARHQCRAGAGARVFGVVSRRQLILCPRCISIN